MRPAGGGVRRASGRRPGSDGRRVEKGITSPSRQGNRLCDQRQFAVGESVELGDGALDRLGDRVRPEARSEEHTSELQSLMRISYAVFCLKKNKKTQLTTSQHRQR